MTNDRISLENPPVQPPVSGYVTSLKQPAAHPPATARETAQRVGLPGLASVAASAAEAFHSLALIATTEEPPSTPND